MFTFACDSKRSALVGIQSGAGSDADYRSTVEALLGLAARSNQANEVATVILSIQFDEGAQHPNALWRKRLADADKRFRRSRLALVTNSTVVTGIFRIVQWLAPPRADTARATFGNFADAVLWAETDAGCRLPFLFDLHGEALKATNDGPTFEEKERWSRVGT